MTDMKKICPKSGESCNCPKGRCLQTNAYTSEMKLANESSHEHDAEQLAVYQQAAVIFTCPSCQSKGFEKSKLPDRCEFCDGTFSGNLPTAEEIEEANVVLDIPAINCPIRQEQECYNPDCTSLQVCRETKEGLTAFFAQKDREENEQAQADRQEAGSLKYALCAQILQLSSGKFALFGAYSMQDGIPLLAIDTWENLEPVVRAYRKTAEDGYQKEKLDEERRRGAREGKATAADYDALFGDQK